MVVLIVEWSYFWGGLKEGFYCITCTYQYGLFDEVITMLPHVFKYLVCSRLSRCHVRLRRDS